MGWKRKLEILAWAAGGGALSGMAEAMRHAQTSNEDILRATSFGAILAVVALLRQWNPPQEPPK